MHDPLAAGFAPAGAALALAAAFMPSGHLLAQPAGALVIHGEATVQQQGNSLVVTTRNGPGTRHSAIDWRSFSVPGGSITHFHQPDAASTSINRVTGSDPSAIHGTLSSNGRLVVVNPSGIAVGAGAAVDTAGFTASTLRMSDADALAGRLVFGGAGAAGPLTVDGRVLARTGDVVLIAPQVQVGVQAVVQAPDGGAILAAGQKVELTGRGLEGIRLQVQAPDDQALNLGTLEGDAVGIFAAQLRHSGLVRATAATTSGGRVVLTGGERAEIGGSTTATLGERGGQVHASARKVVVKAGALIDVSGRGGGGEALIGGGWQGGDGRIANADATTMESGATIRANAIESGNGGTVVVWADGLARVGGRIEARGGAGGGDGGAVETSGKDTLVFRASVDTSAPHGRAGLLLLDPKDITITKGSHRPDDRVVDHDKGADTKDLPAGDSATVSQNALEALGGNVKLEASGTVKFESFDNGVLNMDQVTPGSSLTVAAGGDVKGAANWLRTEGGAVDIRSSQGRIELRGVETKGGAVSLAAGGGTGVMVVNEISTGSDAGIGGDITLDAGGGSLKLGGAGAAKISAGAAGGRGNVTLISSGAVTLDPASTIEARDLKIVAGVGIGDGAGGAMWVDAARVSAENAGSGDISIAHRGATRLTVADLGSGTGVRNAAGAVTISSENGEIAFAADVIAATTLAVSAGTGALVNGGGVLKAGTIRLQTLGAGSGAVGARGAPLKTASSGASSTFEIGGTAGAGGVFIEHSGHAVLAQARLGLSSPLSMRASGGLTALAALDTGSSPLALAAGPDATLTVGNRLAAAAIELEADRMDWSSSPGIAAGGGLLWVKTASTGRRIDLGARGDAAADTLELSSAELSKLGGTGVLRIGSLGSAAAQAAGPIHISEAIAPAHGGTLALETRGGVTQAAGASLGAPRLAVRALGAVALEAAGNWIGEVAAEVGDGANTGASLRVRSGRALNIGAGLDGIRGIRVRFADGGPGGLISLHSGGAVTQSPRAEIHGRELVARGRSVRLDGPNAAGLVAGRATGAGPGDGFSYRGRGDVVVASLDGVDGVQARGPVDLSSHGHLTVGSAIDAGSITLKALERGKDVRVDADLFASGSGGIDIAAARHVDFGVGSRLVRATAGPIAVTAGADPADTGGAVRGEATFHTGGGSAGAVGLRASGDLAFGAVVADGAGAGMAGGQVKLASSAGSVTGAGISARGHAQGGGGGGTVNVSAARDVDLKEVEADGGFNASAAGGDGGLVEVAANAGKVTLHGPATARGGGSAAGAGGDGGTVRLSAATALTVRAAQAQGGSGGSAAAGAGAAGGAGGQVVLTQRSGDLVLDGKTTVDAGGGDGGSGQALGGAGGSGGRIMISASAGGVVLQAGSRFAADGAAGGRSRGSSAQDRGGDGGAGGVIAIDAAALSQMHGQLSARGGDGGWDSLGSADGGNGGNGGTVAVALAARGASAALPALSLAGRVDVGGGQAARPAAAPASEPGARGARGRFAPEVAGRTTVADSLEVDGEWLNAGDLLVPLLAAGHAEVRGELRNTGTIVVDGALRLSNPPSGASGPGTLVNEGTMNGRGTVHGHVDNRNIVAPGRSPGMLRVDGDFTQAGSGTLQIEVNGSAAGTGYDRLEVSGRVALDGRLEVTGSHAPAPGERFDIIAAPAITGTFASASVPLAYRGLLTAGSRPLPGTGSLPEPVPVPPLLPASQAAPEQAVSELASSPLNTFAALLAQEQHQQEQQARAQRRAQREKERGQDQDDKRADDVVVDGDTCRP